eukprot:3083988-Pleurochrysis_carterae.AAC.1
MIVTTLSLKNSYAAVYFSCTTGQRRTLRDARKTTEETIVVAVFCVQHAPPIAFRACVQATCYTNICVHRPADRYTMVAPWPRGVYLSRVALPSSFSNPIKIDFKLLKAQMNLLVGPRETTSERALSPKSPCHLDAACDNDACTAVASWCRVLLGKQCSTLRSFKDQLKRSIS